VPGPDEKRTFLLHILNSGGQAGAAAANLHGVLPIGRRASTVARNGAGRSPRPEGRDTVFILPAIDLRGGQCVRLRQGDYDQETVFGDDPAARVSFVEKLSEVHRVMASQNTSFIGATHAGSSTSISLPGNAPRMPKAIAMR